jgi:hypothetical protein
MLCLLPPVLTRIINVKITSIIKTKEITLLVLSPVNELSLTKAFQTKKKSDEKHIGIVVINTIRIVHAYKCRGGGDSLDSVQTKASITREECEVIVPAKTIAAIAN